MLVKPVEASVFIVGLPVYFTTPVSPSTSELFVL